MDKFLSLKMKIIYRVAILAFIISIILLIITDKAVLLGWIYGSVLGLLNWLLLANTMQKAVKMPPTKARAFAVFHYILRFAVLFLALLVSIKRQDMHVLATIIALVLPKAVILWEHLAAPFLKRSNN